MAQPVFGTLKSQKVSHIFSPPYLLHKKSQCSTDRTERVSSVCRDVAFRGHDAFFFKAEAAYRVERVENEKNSQWYLPRGVRLMRYHAWLEVRAWWVTWGKSWFPPAWPGVRGRCWVKALDKMGAPVPPSGNVLCCGHYGQDAFTCCSGSIFSAMLKNKQLLKIEIVTGFSPLSCLLSVFGEVLKKQPPPRAIVRMLVKNNTQIST